MIHGRSQAHALKLIEPLRILRRMLQASEMAGVCNVLQKIRDTEPVTGTGHHDVGAA